MLHSDVKIAGLPISFFMPILRPKPKLTLRQSLTLEMVRRGMFGEMEGGKCPQCERFAVTTVRRPDGSTWNFCRCCGYEWETEA